MHQRIGWFVLKTHRPPGRSTRATSRITAALSGTKGIAPNAEQATSIALLWQRNGAGVRLNQQGSGLIGGGTDRRLRMAQLAGRDVQRDDPAPWVRSQRAHWAAPHPTSSTSFPASASVGPSS